MSGGASGGDYGAMAATGGSEESKTEGLLASDDVHVAGERKVVMYGFPGSQFVMKAMVALEARGVDYTIRYVDVTKLRKQIPAPHTVPQLEWTESGETTRVVDSTDILELIDEKCKGDGKQALFPGGRSGQAYELEELGDTVLDVWSRYFNWVDREGFDQSIALLVKKRLPCCIACCLTPYNLAPIKKSRAKYVRISGNVLGEENLASREAAVEGLLKTLDRYEASLGSDEQKYLVPDTTGVTAADCIVYAELQRIVGDSGDAHFPPCLPGLLEENKARLPRLGRWYQRMCNEHPIAFKPRRDKEWKPPK